MPRLFATVALLALAAPARGQVVVGPASPGVVYYYPAAGGPTPPTVARQ